MNRLGLLAALILALLLFAGCPLSESLTVSELPQVQDLGLDQPQSALGVERLPAGPSQ